ncbi:hypothetical protein ACEPAG_7682 [Sanghuangporus baumii]
MIDSRVLSSGRQSHVLYRALIMAPFIDFAQPGVRSFSDVEQSDAGVNTLQFLEAATGVVRILELLNPITFKPVIDDMNGNIEKIRKRYLAAQVKSATVEELVRNEMSEGSHTATQGLVWLIRGLLFTSGALKRTQGNPNLKLSEAFQESYTATLRPFHNFIVKGVFAVAMSVCPAREEMYVKLKEDKDGGPPATQEQLDEKLNKWLAALEQIATRIDTFSEVNKYKKGL